MKSYITLARAERGTHLFRLLVGGSVLSYLLQIHDHKTGVCPTTIQQIESECGLTRQQVRTAIRRMKGMGILSVKTYAGAVKGERGFRKVSTITLNLQSELFTKPKEYLGTPELVQDIPVDEYTPEFEEDWKVYCGTSRDKVGQKKPAYKSWLKAVAKHGRDRVMQGTVAYVATCESKKPATWKKNGSTWWNAKEARYLDPEFQRKDNPSVAFWKLMNSPVLGNLLKGGHRIVVKGDDYMAEALIRLKGSDPFLGDTLDRLRDRKFEEGFKHAYDLAKRSANPRTEIYKQYENPIIWDLSGPSGGDGAKQQSGEGTVGVNHQ